MLERSSPPSLDSEVHTELRAAFNHDLSIVELFKHPTVASLAERRFTSKD